MNLKFLSLSGLDHLRQGIAANRQAYLKAKVPSLLAAIPSGGILESRIAVDDPPALYLPAGDNLRDADNARLIYTWLSRLPWPSVPQTKAQRSFTSTPGPPTTPSSSGA